MAYGFSPDEDHKPKNERIFKERPITWLYKFLLWVDSKKKRKVEIHIDRWDTYNLYNTLSLIILPLLKQFKEKNTGHPNIDVNDVPEEFKNLDMSDDKFYENNKKIWDWIIDEMIWTFQQLQPYYDWEEQYQSGECDFYHEVSKTDENGKPKLYQLKTGPDHTFEIDNARIKKHQERIDNGLRLFGKYFQSLWQ